MKLFEGIRVSKSILDRVLKESDDIRMGFECEFNSPWDFSDSDNSVNITHLDVDTLEMYFDMGEFPDRRTFITYISDNGENLAAEAGFDAELVADEFLERKLDNDPKWYKHYLDEHGMWNLEDDEPTTEGNVPDEDEVKDIIKSDLLNDAEAVDDRYFTDYLASERNDFITTHYSDRQILDDHYESDPKHFIEEYELELKGGYVWSDDDSDVFTQPGMEYQNIIDGFDSRFAMVLYPLSDYHGEEKDLDSWYIEPDASLGEYGAEVSSAVYPLREALVYMEQFFDFMQDEELTTDESTGLHVSLSYTDNDEADIDWVKLALLMGEEHTLRKFDRMGNEYTASQLKRIEKHAKEQDISKLRKWSGFKELASVAVSSMQDRSSTINFSEFGSTGRIEIRIMGNAGYETRFEEIRFHILRFVMMMKIATDESLFKREYMKKFAALAIRAQEDALQPAQVEVSNEVKDNKYFKMAQRIFRNRAGAAKSVAEFIQSMEAGDKNRALDYLKSITSLVVADNSGVYNSLLEAKQDKVESVKRNLLRGLVREYGITVEDLDNYYGKSVEDALDYYIPIADEWSDVNLLGSMAYQWLTPTEEQEQQIALRRKWVINHIPALRKVENELRSYFLQSLTPNSSPFMAGSDLTKIYPTMVNAVAKRHPTNKVLKQFLIDVLEFRGYTLDDIDIEELTPQGERYLGMDVGTAEAGLTELQAKVEMLLDRFAKVLRDIVNVDDLTEMFTKLLTDDVEKGERMLLTVLLKYMKMHEDSEGEVHEVMGTPQTLELRRLAAHFKPGQNIQRLPAVMGELQRWLGVSWL